MNWTLLKYDDSAADEGISSWDDLGGFETEHSWLGDADVQRLGQQHGAGSYMLLPPLGAYDSRIELTIAARQTFHTVTAEEPEVPVEVPAGIEEGSALDAVLDPRD